MKAWRDLSSEKKTALIALGVCEAALTAIAARDLAGRRAYEVRRLPKALWWPVLFIQPVGPVAYLVAGRPRTDRAVRWARQALEGLVDVTVPAGPCDSVELIAPTSE